MTQLSFKLTAVLSIVAVLIQLSFKLTTALALAAV